MKRFSITLIISFIGIILLSNTSSPITPNNPVNIKLTGDNHYNILIIDKDNMEFGVSTEKPKNVDFYTNSNFFDNNSAIGLVVINKRRIQKRTKGGGYFYVVNGKPYIKSRECPSMTDFASQTILWGIDNGRINQHLIDRPTSKLKRYRTIIGENSKGQIMIIASNRIGMVTIEEIIKYSKSKDMIEGILLDGGSSVDYKFSDGTNEESFQSVPSSIKPFFNIEEPKTYIYGIIKNK